MNQQLTTLAKQFRELKTKHDAQKEVLAKIAAEWTEIETQLLEAMVEEGVNAIKLTGLGQFIMVTKNRLSVNAANKPQFFQYLKASGHGALLKEDVNPNTLSAFLKAHLEELVAGHAGQLDPVDARKRALEFLNSQGASYFSERGITLRSE